MLELSALTQWLSAHDQFILPSVGFIAFIESLAIAGIVVPGVALLFAIAALASLSDVPLEAVLLSAFLGAVAGDVLSFFIGRAFHAHLPSKWPFSRYPDALKQGEIFFEKYGALSVVIGRFVGPLRPVLPITAGMLYMSPSKFIIINILSALAWAPAYILPGYLSAELSQSAIGDDDTLLFLCLAIALVITLLPWLGVLRLFNYAKQRPTALLYCFSFSLFGLITTSSFMLNGYLDRLDVWAFSLAVIEQDNPLRLVFVAITLAGDQLLLIMLFVITSLMLCFQKHWQSAIVVAATGITTSLVTHGLKALFSVQRPDLVLGNISSLAFPSGHTSGFSVFVGLFLGLAIHQSSRRLIVPKLATVLLITLVAGSRLALGVHWVSDIVAGLLLGAAITSVALWFEQFMRNFGPILERSVEGSKEAHRARSIDIKPIAITLVLVTALYISLFFDTAAEFYSLR